MDNKQEEQIELVNYKPGTTGSRTDIVRNYTEMIKRFEDVQARLVSINWLQVAV